MKQLWLIPIVALNLAPRPALAGEPADLLIWGGGPHKAAAKVYERAWSTDTSLSSWLGLEDHRGDAATTHYAARQLASETLPGLKPGHQILIVGVCEKGRGANAARKLRRLLPGIYARTAQVPPGWTISRCETPELSTRLELKAGTQVLRLFQSPYDRTPTPGPPCHYRGTLMIAALVDTRTNTPQAFSVLEEALSVSGVCPDGPIALECSDTDVDRVQGAAQIRWQCQWGAAETGGEPGSMVRQARLSIHGRKIRESLRTLSQNVGRK